MGSATNIDLAQEEQVDVFTQVSKAKPCCTAPKVCGSLSVSFSKHLRAESPQVPLLLPKGALLRTLGHRSHGPYSPKSTT